MGHTPFKMGHVISEVLPLHRNPSFFWGGGGGQQFSATRNWVEGRGLLGSVEVCWGLQNTLF